MTESEYLHAVKMARLEAIEECAVIAEKIYGGKAHTYASENADVYYAQDETCGLIAKSIRALVSNK